jgi:hypothetical protein
MDGLSKRLAKKGKRTTRGWPAASFVKIVARVTAATSSAWFSTVTEAAQSSPGRSAALDLSLEEFVAGANSFLNRSKIVTQSDGVFTRTFRWAGREGHVQFIVLADEKLRSDVSVPWRAADVAEMLQEAGIRLIAAVSAKLSAKERREIAAALLKFSRSDSEKSYSLEIAGVRHSCTLMLPACHAVSARAPKQ